MAPTPTLEEDDGIDTYIEDQIDGEEADEDLAEGDGEGDEGDLEGEDHEGEDDGQEGRADQVAERPAKAGRANETIRSLRREAQESKRQLEDLRRQTEQLQRSTQQQRNAESEAAERERVLLMSPEERMDYRLEQIQRQNQHHQQQLELRMAEQTDKAAFDAKASVSPVYKQYAPVVEKRLVELRSQGSNVPREVLMKFIIGEKALEKAEAAKSRQSKRGQAQARQQAGRSSNPRGQQPAEGRRQGKTAAERLEGVKF